MVTVTTERIVRNLRQTTDERARHWDAAYAGSGVRGASWFQAEPRVSLDLIDALGVSPDASVIDVGGGASRLADHLVKRGFVDVSVLDLSATALAETGHRLADAAPVDLLYEDLLVWRPERRFDLWHDRAVFHFLVTPDDRDKYVQTLRSAVPAGGHVVLGTFAADGPELCSGLPVRRYSVTDLTEALGADFKLLETRREAHVTPRGLMQPFTWVGGRMGSA